MCCHTLTPVIADMTEPEVILISYYLRRSVMLIVWRNIRLNAFVAFLPFSPSSLPPPFPLSPKKLDTQAIPEWKTDVHFKNTFIMSS